MKRTLVLLVFIAAAVGLSHAQLASAPTDTSRGSPVAPAITERGPHHRVWSHVTWETNPQGQLVAATNSAYTELSTGLHFQSPTTGAWTESEARFEIMPDGYAVARRGQHQVILAPNINATNAVDMQMPDGRRLTSWPLGLAFHDTASGKSVLIAELKDCAGQWLSPNVVIYLDAFDGLKAALRYTYTREGFEQDVVLYENPGSPAAYGLDPPTTQLETWTEFFRPPTPKLTTVTTRDGSEEQRVEFGAMALGQGQAYFLDLANRVEPSLPVRKTWQQIGGRTFLVESVRHAVAKPLLDRLVSVPETTVGLLAQKVMKNRGELVAQFTQRSAAEPKLVASMTPGRMIEQSGLVLDYTTINSTQTNYVFKGDSTYYISGTVNLNATTTFEGGTVIKYAPTNSPCLTLNGPSVWQGVMYRPSVFTARDDNTVGETISGSTGNPSTNYYGSAMVKLNYDASPLKYLRVSYASKAIQLGAWSQSHSLSHAQLLNCQYGFCNYADDDLALTLHNVLVYKVPGFGYGDWTHYYGEQVTIDQSTNVNDTIVLTNSLIVASSGFSGGTSNAFLSSGTGVFQTVGAASHYLAAGSTNRNAGTTNISAGLLAELKQRTTYPPVEITTNITGDTVLALQAQRDTDTADLGYHYDPLDYVVSGRTITNATLTLTNGVALGTYGTSGGYGVYLRKGSKLVSGGAPTALNQIVRYNTVQEQSTTNWSASSVASCVKVSYDSSPQAQGSFTFTGWSLLGGKGYHLNANGANITTPFVFKDCQLGPGYIDVGQCSTVLTNCLLERVNASMEVEESGYSYYGYNNLFRLGSLDLGNYGNGTYQFKDNLFDQTTISQSGTITHDYNGYVTNKNRLYPNGAHDVILTNSPIYQTSWLGRYYYPTNDGMLSRLIDAGSRWATNAMLYHYTTTTNQVKEASSKVDIGFHYVAVDANGNPIDTDGDGVPDYIEDKNGNGQLDSGETPWNIAILSQPLSQTVDQGDAVTFGVIAQGVAPLSYQWLFNGTAIAGETNDALTLASVQSSQAGDYSVRVTNATGLSMLSSNATLTVQNPDYWPLVALTGPRQNYTFKNGVTYYVASRVELHGTTTIEGGATIKPDWYYPDSTLAVMGTLVCKTEDAYFPAFLTSVDDDTVGDVFYYSSGAPVTAGNGAPYLDLTSAQDACPTLNNLRIRYADQGVTTPAAKRLDVWDCQFVHCNTAVAAGQGATAACHNVLFAGGGSAVAGLTNFAALTGEHVTAEVTNFWVQAAPARISLTNSIIIGTLGNGPTLVADHCAINPVGPVFQPVGVGNYYLTNNSSYRSAGTTNASPRLLTEFRQKTTQPPIAFPTGMELTGELTLFPQVARYTSGPPDLGYHYDALDYTVASMFVNGGTITMLPGTAVGFREEQAPASWYPQDYTYEGFDLWNGATLVSHGTATRPNTFADVQLVQEGTSFPCIAWLVPGFLPTPDGTPPPVLDFRFSNFYAPSIACHLWSGYSWELDWWWSQDSRMFWKMQDCNLRGGKIIVGIPIPGTDWNYVWGDGSIEWVNNSFDRVGIRLDPTMYQAQYAISVDLAVSAYNNLFRGGWLILNPIPATAGDWTFKDNLFDKVPFKQLTTTTGDLVPLDHDYNGYWPCTSGELDWNQYAAHLLLDIATPDVYADNDKQLTAAPGYQTGPLGNYYLPASGPLYHGGSRTVVDAGLYHYTTRVDQTKAGSETGNVNIGRHYVATAGQTSTAPKETDGDGIPDFVENWHGDGDTGANRIHTDDETDWQAPYTVSGVYDPTNAVYDDVDLSGSGLVGRIKKAMGLTAFDTSNPLALTQVITGEEPDIATFSLPISYAAFPNLGELELLCDGNAVEFQQCSSDIAGNCLLKWNTTYDSPGQHYVQARIDLHGTIMMGDTPDPTILWGVGQPTSFFSANAVQFDDFYSEFDDSGATLYAKMPTYAYTEYAIELKTSAGAHIRTISNSTSNGEINEPWDLTDDNGNPVTGDMFMAFFTVTPQGGTPKTSPEVLRKYVTPVADGKFTVAYTWDSDRIALDYMWTAVESGAVNPLISPPESGGSGSLTPYESDFNAYTWSGDSVGDPGYLSDSSDVTSLTNNLVNLDTRNFFFVGDGSPVELDDGSRAQVKIDITGLRTALGNCPWLNPASPIYRSHPYRFVWLYACDTADDPRWCRAFGIRPALTPQEISARPNRAQAFLGFKGTVLAPSNVYTPDAWNDVRDMWMTFYYAWMRGANLQQCKAAASDPSLAWPLGKRWPWPIQGFGFWPPGKWVYSCTPVIYGYPLLRRDGATY